MIYVGIDWADDHHQVAITDDSAETLSQFQISHDTAGFAMLREQIARFCSSPDQVLVALETSRGLLVHELLRCGYWVYAINPKALNRYKDRYVLSRAKSDPIDALGLTINAVFFEAIMRNTGKAQSGFNRPFVSS